jgi:hypothetical protein
MQPLLSPQDVCINFCSAKSVADIPAERGETGACLVLTEDMAGKEREGARVRALRVPRDPLDKLIFLMTSGSTGP